MKRVQLVIAFTLAFSPAIGAARADQSRLSLMIRSSSKSILQKSIKVASQMRRWRAFCEAELNSAALPVSCFSLLKAEDRETEGLTKICLQRVRDVTSWTQLNSALREPHVSERCRFKVRERLEDLHYQAETDAPLRLFRESDPKSDWSGF